MTNKAQISWILGAYEVRILWIFTNLMDIWGPKGYQSHGYLWISWIFRTYEVQISWIFWAYEAQISWIFGAYEARSPWYLGPMKGESHGYLQISRTFMNLLDIWGLWSTNHLDIWSIWSATLQDIRETPGYSGPMKCWMFWACIIWCSQFAKGKLFLDWQPLKSIHPYVLL